MGYYIECESPKGKAEYLQEKCGGWILPLKPESFSDISDDKALICVVDNGPFEAAALCFSEEEFIAFSAPDILKQGDRTDGLIHYIDLNPTRQRPRTWVLMDKRVAYAMSGYKKRGD